jgi:putative AbiEii toxin of type IV toxin-antitoxin system
VGENNAGKTSVLEAVEILLLAPTHPYVLTRGPTRRREGIPPLEPEEDRAGDWYIDLRHLFHGREISPGSRFSFHGETARGVFSVTCTVEPGRARIRPLHFAEEEEVSEEEDRPSLDIVLTLDPPARTSRVPLELPRIEALDRFRRYGSESGSRTSPLQFVETAAPLPMPLGALWDRIVLTPEENKVIDALRIIQPDIERIASLSQSYRDSGGIFLKLQHSDRRVPLGSMGEGLKRLLVLAMNLVRSAGGYLLVDEIDTGLHYSVMVKMWKLVVETARRLDIQVFATTHSLDCIQALAGLYENEPDVRDEISLHRIEKGAEASIRYSADEILAAARRQVEVR